MSDLLERLRDMAAGKHDDLKIAAEAIEEIIDLNWRVVQLEEARDELRSENSVLRADIEVYERDLQLHQMAIGIVDGLRAEVAELRQERDEARANYQFMVERAADERLDGYRELGARAAAAEGERDALRAQIAEVEKQRDFWKEDAQRYAVNADHWREQMNLLRAQIAAHERECAGVLVKVEERLPVAFRSVQTYHGEGRVCHSNCVDRHGAWYVPEASHWLDARMPGEECQTSNYFADSLP